MESLKLSFTILAACGIWKPIHWSSKLKEQLYNIWRFFFAPLPYLLASGQMARIMLVDMYFEELMEILFILLSVMNICSKSVSFLIRRRELAYLSNMLSTECATAQNSEEANIQNQYRQFIRCITLASVILVETTAITFLLPPFFQNKNNRSLPFKIWLPYDYSSDKIFWITYVPESISIITVSLISVSSNTLIFGFLIETCAQFELLTHRFTTLLQCIKSTMNQEKVRSEYEIYNLERHLMIRYIRHHVFIFRFVDTFKGTFSSAIVSQYIVSSLVISMSVYQLSTNKTFDVVFLTNLLYLMCMLVEFFLYCWFGNELTLKSEELGKSVFKINWTSLSPESNKDLLVILHRSLKPLIISTNFFVILSLDSFMKIIKLSYSAFSVLRTASNEE